MGRANANPFPLEQAKDGDVGYLSGALSHQTGGPT
jgi:hypothetical protein